MFRLLFGMVLAIPLFAADPPKNLGNKIGMSVVSEGVVSLYERGMVLDYPDGTTLTSTFNMEPMVLRATWTHNSPAGPIQIEVEYEIPVANPSDAQMRIYAERFKRMVAIQQLVFPPAPLG